MIKGFKCRIYPNKTQLSQIKQILGCSRFVHNYFLAMRQAVYETENKTLSRFDCNKLLPQLKRSNEFGFLKIADSMALQESILDLDNAFKNFFAKRAGYPRFHSKHDSYQSYRTRNQQGSVTVIDNHHVKLPKLGIVKVRGLRKITGVIKQATISLAPTDKYFLSLNVDIGDITLQNRDKIIGVDLGVKTFATLSDGRKFEGPNSFRKYQRKLARAQRRLSRKEPGSNNRDKQRIKVAAIYEKISNIRKDFLHKLSSQIAGESQTVYLEDLNVKTMLGSHILAKSISDQGWSVFHRVLQYKLEERGSALITIPKTYPSSQLCSKCGYQNTGIKNLNIRHWECPECHTKHDRGINAAINILNKGLSMATP